MINPHLIILKIGGSCITYKDQSEARLRRNFLKRMACEVASALHTRNISLIIVHGGGGVTHPLLDFYDLATKLKTGIVSTKQEKNSAAKIHVAMNELNNRVTQALQMKDIPAWPIQTSAIAYSSHEDIPALFLDTIRVALELGIVPVLHGDLVLDDKKGSRIFSGDALACMLSRDLSAERLLFLSDVQGIYTSHKDISSTTPPLDTYLVSDEEDETSITGRLNGIDHSGGMREKVRAIKNICSGAHVRIFSGLVDGNITKALLDESIGTQIVY